MLDAVIDYLPSPLDVTAIKGTLPDTDEEVLNVIQMMMNHSQLCI